MNAPPFRWALLSPHHWPAWLGVALLRLVCLLPIPWLIRLGEGVGWLFGKLAGGRRNVVRVNLRLCFPQQSEAEREAAVDAHFRALGAGLFEACLAWWATDEQLRRQGEVVGIENLERAMADVVKTVDAIRNQTNQTNQTNQNQPDKPDQT